MLRQVSWTEGHLRGDSDGVSGCLHCGEGGFLQGGHCLECLAEIVDDTIGCCGGSRVDGVIAVLEALECP